MTSRIKPSIYVLAICIAIAGCNTAENKTASKQEGIDNIVVDAGEGIQLIRDNFQRINAIMKWGAVDTADVDESAEGGEILYYYHNDSLQKMVLNVYGETGKRIAEYYLLKGDLSFVIEKSETYNRPIYADSAAMKENNDTQVFDKSWSEIEVDSVFYDNDQMVLHKNNQDCGAPDGGDFIEKEGKRILADYKKWIALLKQ